MEGLKEITIGELQNKYLNKELSIKEVVEAYIKRIEKYDQGEKGLNSVLEINPDAIRIAEELDKQGQGKNQLLYGVPIMLKDNIATADGMHTSAGSLALADSYATDDADIVKKLRQQGAIIIGKTNMTEFANFMTKNMPGGYSSRGGRVIHPYNPGKDPSGSSTGSAVAVTANLCTASIGTDTSNSIVAPGLSHGIVGLRPSTGVLSQKGIIPISFTLDTAGPFTRKVEDAATMFAGLTNTPIVQGDYNLRGKTIGYNEWNMDKSSKDTIARTEEVIRELEKAGAIVKRVYIADTPHILNVMKYEFKYGINEYLAKYTKDASIRSLEDIIAFNIKNKEKALKYGQTHLVDSQKNTSGSLNEKLYQVILKDREESKRKIRAKLQDVDFCIMLSYSSILMYTGLPAITIPCGLGKDNMPFGIQMTALTDEKLIRNAFAVEKIVGQRVKPL
ncbi:MAG: amidase [Clostridiales bacterium]|nr:amidase [Clostridiales bacterium]